MSLYCMNCRKWVTNKTHPCSTKHLISLTENMLPVVHILADGLMLQVVSAFCLTENNQIEAGVYFNCIYPEILLQDLPTGWYWTDYVTIDNKVLCSCLSYEAEYINNDNEGLEEFVEGVINDLLGYLKTRDRDGLRSIMLLTES